jgi:pentatricopeptide repeat protein
LTPTIPIYTDILYCLAKAGMYQDAIKVYNNMSIPPEAIIYNLVLEIATLARDAILCEKLVREMWEKGISIHPLNFDPIRKLADMKSAKQQHKELTLE